MHDSKQTLPIQHVTAKKLALAVEQSPVGLAITDLTGTIEYINPAFSKMTGYTYEEAVGQNTRILKSGRMPDSVYANLWKTIKAGLEWNGALLNKRKNGELYWEEAAIRPFRDDNGAVTHFLALKVDITARKRAEAALERQVDLQTMVLDLAVAFVNKPHEEIDAAMTNALATAGRFCGVDRACVFTYDTESATVRHTHEWCAQDLAVDCQFVETDAPIALQALQSWWDAHRVGLSVYLPRVEQLPDDSAWRRALEARGVRSMISFPLVEAETCYGFVGFAAVREAREWAGEETALLRILAVLLTNAESRRRREVALMQARAAAEAANRSKSDFLAVMSHELRTPMNGVLGMTRLLMETDLTPLQADYLNKVERSASALLGILNDILDFSRIEARRIELEEIPFALEESIDDVVSLMADRVQEKRLNLAVSIDPTVPRHLVGDPLRLNQVLVNLVGNAVKFTDQGCIAVHVRAGGERHGGRVELLFRVTDSGIGMDAATLDQLFEPFTQADASTARRYGGTGLGLSISKRLVELMGGAIRAHSERGRGSTFEFSAWFEPVQPFAARDRATGTVDKPAAGRRILIVDESIVVRQSMHDVFVAMGAEVEMTGSVSHALEFLENAGAPFDLVFWEWDTPEMDGPTVARMLRTNTRIARTPTVVLMTRTDVVSRRATAEHDQLGTVLAKPFGIATVRRLLLEVGTQAAGSERGEAGAEKAPPISEAVRGARILVVEDNEINQQVARFTLERAGAQVETAADGEQAVAMVHAARYDAVLMDVHMPRLSGYEAARRMRGLPNGVGLPIIAMTASAMKEDRARSLSAGMDDHVTKPLDTAELFGALARGLSRSVQARIGGHGTADTAHAVAGVEAIAQVDGNADTTSPIHAPAAEFGSLPETIPGIDREAVMRRFMGNEAVVAELLLDFYRFCEERVPAVRSAVGAGRYTEATRLVHNIKGAAGNLNAEALYLAATQMEHELLNTLHPVLDDLLEHLEAAAAELLRGKTLLQPERRVPSTPATTESAASDDSVRLGVEALQALLPALRARKPVRCRAALQAVGGIPLPAALQPQFRALEQRVVGYDYDSALRIASELIEQLQESPNR